MITSVDTNVLLDILLADELHVDASKELIDAAYADGALIICDVVYSELAAQFDNVRDLEEFLSRTGIRLVPSDRASLQAAAAAWRKYTINRDDRLQCASRVSSSMSTATSAAQPSSRSNTSLQTS